MGNIDVFLKTQVHFGFYILLLAKICPVTNSIVKVKEQNWAPLEVRMPHTGKGTDTSRVKYWAKWSNISQKIETDCRQGSPPPPIHTQATRHTPASALQVQFATAVDLWSHNYGYS